MLKVKKGKDIKKYQHHYKDDIKTELETVYITTSGDKYLKKMDALCAESQIQQAKESKQRRGNKIMDIVNILFKILEENNWGIFYGNNPVRSLDTQDGGTLYEVNKVDLDEVERVLLNKLDSEGTWKHTQPPTPENL